MDSTLVNYLQAFRDGSEFYTHISQLIPNTGKFRIERKNSENFWKLYCDLLEKKGDTFISGLSERPREYVPILADIDISIDYEEELKYDKNFYSFEQVKRVIDIYIDSIKYICPNFKNEDLTCFLLEKPSPYLSGCRIKNGFHLHFPFFFMSNIDQDMHLIPLVMEQVEKEKIFENLGITHSSEVIDKSCSKKHWLMYGSRKDKKLTAYKLTKVFNWKGQEITLEEAVKHQTLYNDYGEEILFEKSIEYYLPRILSIEPLNRPNYEARRDIEVKPKKQLLKAEQVKRVYENMSVTQTLDAAKKYMTLLNLKRADDYNQWIEIGWILYNIGEGCQEALELWINFSRQTSLNNFSEAGCVYRWNKMTKRDYSLGSLKYFAKCDSPQKYQEIQIEEQRKLINSSLSGGHSDIAKQLYDKYNTQFVCAGLKDDIWFEFRDHRWRRVEKGITLRSKITAELIPRYIEELKHCTDFIQNEDNQGAEALKKQQLISKIIGCLKQAPFKDNIMKECKEFFYKENFLEKLDKNIYLLGFENGVLDLRTKEFRDGKPDDYITLSTGYDYREFQEDDPEVIDVKDFLLKIFVNRELRQHALEYFAELLKGGNFSKNFYVMSGCGDNGKSVLMELLEKVFGPSYMVPLSPTVLTGKETDSASASPDIELTKTARFVTLQEPSGNSVIGCGILKRLTGNDTIYTRGLHKEAKPMVPMFKLCLICNRLPRIELDGSEAVWNRLRVLLFQSKFPKDSSEVPATFEEQIEKKIFHRDNNFSEKLPYMKQAMMWLMFETYKYITKYGKSAEPKIVTQSTYNYHESNDFYLQFINERIIQEKSASLNISEVFAEFKTWFHETQTGMKLPNKNDLKEELIKRWGPMRGTKWQGYRFKTIRDEEQEGDKIAMNDEDFTDGEPTDNEEN